MTSAAAAVVSVVQKGKMSVPDIKELDQLNCISNSALCQALWGSNEIIFAYARDDFVKIMEQKDPSVLKDIKQFLCDEAEKMFPEFKTRKPVNRKEKNNKAAAQDIFDLGYSIINKKVTINMDKIYNKTNNVIQEEVSVIKPVLKSTSELAKIFSLVTDMQSKMEAFELQAERSRRKIEELELLVERSKACKCVCNSVTIASADSKTVPNVLVPDAFGTAVSATLNNEPLPNAEDQSRVPANCNLPQQGQSSQRSRESACTQPDSDTSDTDMKPYIVKRKKKCHQNRQAKSIQTGVNPVLTGTMPEKRVDMFIGPVDKQNSVNDMRDHMEKHEITDISDIVEIPLNSGLKAFKVTIAKSKSEDIKNIWPKGMKVDKFRANKIGSSKKPNKPYKDTRHTSYNRAQVKKQPFRRESWQGHSNHRDKDNWRVNRKWQPSRSSRHTEDNTREMPQQDSYWEAPYNSQRRYPQHNFQRRY